MDPDIEHQVTRILTAFEKAADKHWGSKFPKRLEPPRKRRPGEAPRLRPTDWRKTCPVRQRIRAFLRDNPMATNGEVSDATGAGHHMIAEIRKETGCKANPNCARSAEHRQRIAAAFAANPAATGQEIASRAGVSERYAQDVVRRLRREAAGAE